MKAAGIRVIFLTPDHNTVTMYFFGGRSRLQIFYYFGGFGGVFFGIHALNGVTYNAILIN